MAPLKIIQHLKTKVALTKVRCRPGAPTGRNLKRASSRNTFARRVGGPGLQGLRQLAALLGWSFATALIAAAPVDTTHLPAPVQRPVDFERDIQPIFQQSCLRCHGPQKPKSDFQLTSREAALKGGASGAAIIPGKSVDSPLIHYVARLVEDMEMPPPGKGDPLSPEQIALLRAWIDQGVAWTNATPEAREKFALRPAFGWLLVEGDHAKFREQQWVKDGAAGGFDYYEATIRVDERTRSSLSGHALRDDYSLNYELQRRDLGFVHAGFTKYYKYYDDSGGFLPGLPELTLDRDLALELGKVWAEVGLVRPNLPRMVLGYEYSYRDGAKSTLQWRTFGPLQKSLRPSGKDIDEKNHLLRLDVSHTLAGFDLEDNFRFESYDLHTARDGSRPFPFNGSGEGVIVNDDQDQKRVANTFRAERQVTDWLFLSAGYLYSHVDGDGSVELNTVNVAGAPITGGIATADQIILRQWSHVMNYNAQLGPWQGLTFSAGIQNEWARQEGFGDVRLTNPPFPPPAPATEILDVDTDHERFTIQEQLAVRFNKIPFTSLFAEARLQQEDIRQVEEALGNTPNSLTSFQRATDADRDLKDFRAGFHVSPWTRLSLTGHYRRRLSDNSYDHDRDRRPFPAGAGLGYSAFIRQQDLDTDEAETKLVLRPARWLKTSFAFRLTSTEYETRTDGILAPAPPAFVSGTYNANVYSAGFVLTPLPRLYQATTFSYTDSRSKAAANDVASVVPYRGDIYSVLASLTYALNAKTDLTASYAFSRGDYGQDNFAAGVPVGLSYEQHGALFGVGRVLNDYCKLNLQYGYYIYDEPSSAHQNDYTAHGLFATLTLRWP